MEEEGTAEGLVTEREERRACPRHAVEEPAAIVILERGASFRCSVLDLSMTGCRLRTSLRFPGSAWDRVEVSFKLRGISMRFSGVIQWIDGRQKIGIRFADLTTRRREELAEVLTEVNALNSAKQGIGNKD
jgi:hypothetical protein